jgi:toxin ParE1/3/4
MSQLIKRRPQARRDLVELADHIAKNSLPASDRFLEAAEKAFALLASMPEMGGLWETNNPTFAGLRVWSIRGFEKYLIFYRPIEDGIEVLRVLHGSQDIASIFEA